VDGSEILQQLVGGNLKAGWEYCGMLWMVQKSCSSWQEYVRIGFSMKRCKSWDYHRSNTIYQLQDLFHGIAMIMISSP
jgi:hypothetical protein